MNDSFSALHPALTFCYFAAVLLLTMLVLHPVFLALSLLGALGYCAVLRGWRSLGRTLGWLVPFLVLMAALNALFNHAGVTMLFYLPNGNPVTREALCCLEKFAFANVDIVQVGVARCHEVGSYHMMKGQNPILIVSADAPEATPDPAQAYSEAPEASGA